MLDCIYMQRLFQLFKPQTYDLTLELNREKRAFNGSVKITGTATGSSEIRLHAKELHVIKAAINATPVSYIQENDELVLKPEALHEADEQVIEIEFSGDITDPMHGLYPCYYEHEGKKKEWLATQFESHHAREVFPCVDEPEAKATFRVTLKTEKNVTVLGNMPITKQHKDGDYLVTNFETTPKMSTYLLAFAVGEMQFKETKTKSGVSVRTYATPAQVPESLDFAMQHAADTIDFFDDYFGIAYPLPKCDQIALPDFSSGAMENWGLITYRETTLLADPANTSTAAKQYIAGVITHELSHQWFGNLVTMKWWDDLWLNESFASLMEYVGVHALHPEWDVWLDFGPNDRAPALHRDMLPGVQAIRTNVNHPDEISTLFDPAIVYAKGSTVLNMLRSMIGDEAFREGLRNYFKKHQYGNTAGSDLWDAFAETSGRDIDGFMKAWIEKPGYPVVSLNQQGKQAVISQTRLLSTSKDDSSLWPVPLFAEPRLGLDIFSERKQNLELEDTNFRLLNKGSAGLFVSRYVNTEHRIYFAKQIESLTLEAPERLRLLHEASLLARTGHQSLVEALILALSTENEDRDAVWDIIGLIISDTRRFIEHDKAAETELKRRVRALIAPGLLRLGLTPLDDDNIETKKLRAGLLGLGVWSEHAEALDHALTQFDTFTSPSTLDPDARGIFYSAGAKWRGEMAYEKLFKLYKDSSSAEERSTLASSMTATKEPEILRFLLGHIKDPEVVRAQDITSWFVGLIRKRESRDMTWEWLIENWEWLEVKFRGDKTYDAFPRYVSMVVFGEEWLKKYRHFFEPKMEQPSLKRTISIGLDDIKSRTAWYERDAEGLRKYLLPNR